MIIILRDLSSENIEQNHCFIGLIIKCSSAAITFLTHITTNKSMNIFGGIVNKSGTKNQKI